MRIFFNKYIAKNVGRLQPFEKKKHFTNEPCSLEIYIKMLGMSWIRKIYVDTSLSLHRHKGSDI